MSNFVFMFNSNILHWWLIYFLHCLCNQYWLQIWFYLKVSFMYNAYLNNNVHSYPWLTFSKHNSLYLSYSLVSWYFPYDSWIAGWTLTYACVVPVYSTISNLSAIFLFEWWLFIASATYYLLEISCFSDFTVHSNRRLSTI